MERASILVNSESVKRQEHLVRDIREILSDMSAKGTSADSEHMNEVIQVCASELRERAKIVWACMQRAHESCGLKKSENLCELFRELLKKEEIKIEQTQNVMAGFAMRQLKNKTLLHLDYLFETYKNLRTQYGVEIDIYLENLDNLLGKNVFEQLKNSLLNKKVIAASAVVVVVIVALASFTDAIGKLSGFVLGATSNASLQMSAERLKINNYAKDMRYKEARLVISGMGAIVTIEEGDPDIPYSGGAISATGAKATIFLPKGQPLSVDLSGMGVELRVSSLVKKQVSVNNSGAGASVSVF